MVDQFVVADPAAADRFLVRLVTKLAHDAIQQRGVFVMALSGGSSPLPFYRLLVAAAFPWAQTDVWMVDERFVPDGHAAHNGGAIRVILGAKPRSTHLIDTAKATATEAAAVYAQELSGLSAPDGWPVFDFILLGMGADGHTASLFPGTGAVDVEDRAALAVTPLTAPHQRISLSLPVLNAAHFVVFLVTGAAKQEMLARVLAEKNQELPASLVDPPQGRAIFLGDTQSFPGEIPMQELGIDLP